VTGGRVTLSVSTTVIGADVFVSMSVETIVAWVGDPFPPAAPVDPPSTGTTEYVALRSRGSTWTAFL
jgi:hypothetical protein